MLLYHVNKAGTQGGIARYGKVLERNHNVVMEVGKNKNLIPLYKDWNKKGVYLDAVPKL
jgi:hypothetical protein